MKVIKRKIVTEKLPAADKRMKAMLAVNRGEAPLKSKPKKPVDNSGTD